MYRQFGMQLSEQDVYSVVGTDGFPRLTSAFFQRVRDDALLSSIYPKNDLAGAEARLCSFLIYRFGGPATYIETRGHPRLRMRHAPFHIDRAAADRWFQLMRQSLDEVHFPPDADLVLTEFFKESATFLINRADPAR